MGTFNGAVPANQINSLPLFSTSTIAYGGSVSVLPGAINRYYSPAVTGIDGSIMNVLDADPSVNPPGAANYTIVSNLLDVRGCSRFSVLAAVKMANPAQDVAYTLNLRLMSPVQTDAPTAASPRTGTYGLTAWPLAGSFSLPVTVAGGAAGYKTSGRGWMVGGRDPAAIQSGTLGYVYLWFNFANTAADKTAQLYVSMFACS